MRYSYYNDGAMIFLIVTLYFVLLAPKDNIDSLRDGVGHRQVILGVESGQAFESAHSTSQTVTIIYGETRLKKACGS